jgi:hypothetical protein
LKAGEPPSTGTVRQFQADDPGDEGSRCADARPHGKEVPDIRWLKKNRGAKLFEKHFRSVFEKSASSVSNSRIFDAKS